MENYKAKKSKQTQKNAKFASYINKNSGNMSDLPMCTANRNWEDSSQIFVLFILAVFPLLMGGSKYESITGDKFHIFVGFSIIYFAACFFFFCKNFSGKRELIIKLRGSVQNITYPQLFVMAYVIWNIICAVSSSYGTKTLLGMGRNEGLISALFYCAVFFLLSFWGEYSDIYIYGLSVMSIIFGIIAFAQSLGSGMIYPDGYNYFSSSFLTTVGNMDVVSGVISLVLPSVFAGYVLIESKWRYLCLPGIFLLSYTQFFIDVDSGKIGLLAAAAILTPLLCCSMNKLSGSLQAMGTTFLGAFVNALLNCNENQGPKISFSKKTLVLLVLSVIFIAIGIIFEKSGKQFRNTEQNVKKILAILILIILLISIIFVFLYTGGNTLLAEAHEILHGNLSDTAGTVRGYIWKCSAEIIKNHPIIGSGPGTFAGEFTPYNEGYHVYFADRDVDMAHNDFLQIAVCTGLVGLVIYLAFIISLVIRAFKAEKKCPLAAIMIGACTGYLAHSFFSFSIALVTPLFWVMAGLLDKLVRQSGIKDLEICKETNQKNVNSVDDSADVKHINLSNRRENRKGRNVG